MADDESQLPTFDRPRRLLRRRWPVIVLCVVIGAGAALARAATRSREYSASALVTFRADDVDQKLFRLPAEAGVDPARQAATQQRLASISAVAARTAARFPSDPSARAASGRVTVTPDGVADLISIGVSDSDPRRAAAVSTAFAEEFVNARRDAARSALAGPRDRLRTEIAGLSGAQRRAPDGKALIDALARVTALEAVQTGGAQLAQKADVPSATAPAHGAKDALLGGVLGLLLGLGFAFVLERLDPRIKDPDEVHAAYPWPVLGVVPRARELRRGPGVAELDGVESVLEPFHALRANITYFDRDAPVTSVAITAAASGEGTSTLSWHLALATAAMGTKALFVDANLRDAGHGRASLPGLSEWMVGEANIDEIVQPTRHDTLDVIGCGGRALHPAALVGSTRVGELIRAVESRYDFVVIDAPPAAELSDALPFLSEAGDVLVVVRMGRTRRDAAALLRQRLQQLEVDVRGVVINGARDAREMHPRLAQTAWGRPSPGSHIDAGPSGDPAYSPGTTAA